MEKTEAIINSKDENIGEESVLGSELLHDSPGAHTGTAGSG